MSHLQLRILKRISPRSDTLMKYLYEIQKIALLSPDEESLVSKRKREGDKEAFNLLIHSNLRFVVSVAKQYLYVTKIPLVDLISEGNLGLIRAAEKFDETKGFKFISYAVWWIRQSILAAIMDTERIVKVPRNRQTLIQDYLKVLKNFDVTFERELTLDEVELIEGPGCKLNKLRYMSLGNFDSTPFSPGSGEDGDERKSPEEVLFNPKDTEDIFWGLEQKELSIFTEKYLQLLTPHQRDVVEYYFGVNGKTKMNFADIGRFYGVTTEAARVTYNKAMRSLRKKLVIHGVSQVSKETKKV